MKRKQAFAFWIGVTLLFVHGPGFAQSDVAETRKAGTAASRSATDGGGKECGVDPAPKVDWSGCMMNWIDLSGADLRGANLRGASMLNSNLSQADLSDANLGGALLGGANLQGTDLSGADLRKATLVKSRLTGVILDGARFDGAIYANAKRCAANSIGRCR